MKHILKKITLIFLLFYSNNVFGQEINLSGFYQADLLYDARPGISISYAKNFKKPFLLELEYGNQYINQEYTTSYELSSSIVNAKVFMNNLSLNFLVSVINRKYFAFQLGPKNTLFYINGNEDVHSKVFEYINEADYYYKEVDYTRNPKKAYYSFSNEFRFKFKEVFTPKISLFLNISAGFIINGSRTSGCVISTTDTWAPYSRIGLGISYNLKN